MQTMTYGVMPSREAFEAAFDRAEAFAGKLTFSFGNDKRVGTCEMTCSELWEELCEAHREWEQGASNDEAGDWCSAVLGTLGFEWV